jgi:hypothetical protein
MVHPPEEIRSAALDVLAGRVQCGYEPDEYAHLKIGVGKALRERDGLPPAPPTSFSCRFCARKPGRRNLFGGILGLGSRWNELRPEYDLSKLKGGVRGKYYARARAGTNLVLIEPDLASVFPDTGSVNRALRLLADTAEAAAAYTKRVRRVPNKRLKRAGKPGA